MADKKSVPSSRIGRTARIGSVGASHAMRSAGNRVGKIGRNDRQQIDADNRKLLKTAEQLVDQLSQMKGAAMKFGQVLSTIDIPTADEETRTEFKRIMSKLQDDSYHVSWAQMEKVIVSGLGGKLRDHFSEFDHTPVAAASIGQVYRARTVDGAEVAVKVQYPGVAAAIDTDLRNLKMLSPMIRKLAPGMDVKAIMAELSERISEELDYELEAQNVRTIARLYRGHPYAYVPAVFTSYCSASVLTTEWVEGRSLNTAKDLPQDERNQIAQTIFRFYYDLLYRAGLCCGDPHPGNIMLADTGRVCFLDFGMIKRVRQSHIAAERQLVAAAFAHDAPAVKNAFAQLGYLPNPDDFTPEELLALVHVSYGIFEEDDGLSTKRMLEATMEFDDLRREDMPLFKRLSLPTEGLLIHRMQDILWPVLASLSPVLPWRSMFAENTNGAQPVTEQGIATADFWVEKGKPIVSSL